MSEFSLVVEEADEQFNSLRQLIDHADNRTGDQYSLDGSARIAAANACVLYVAAVFEESVRELGNTYVRLLALKESIPENRMAAIRSGLWERSLSTLASKPFGTRDFDEATALSKIAILKEFCIDKSSSSLMIEGSVYNQRNMRTKEINNVFRRLGIDEISNKIGRCIEFRAFFIVDTVAKAQDEFILFLNEFYEIRNRATRELGVFRSQGAIDTRRYITFLNTAIQRLASVLKADLESLS